MDIQLNATLVIGVTLLVVVLFNIAIYTVSKRRGEDSINQFKLFSRAFQRARNPWKEDQAKLDELSRKVSALEHKPENINEGEDS